MNYSQKNSLVAGKLKRHRLNRYLFAKNAARSSHHPPPNAEAAVAGRFRYPIESGRRQR